MSTMALGSRLLRAPRFWDTIVGKKAVMAVTGVALFGFIVGHLLGNLQFFLGQEKLDDYGRLLHHMPTLLWTARIGLLIAVGLHILATIQLALRKREARPVAYVQRKSTISTYASRTMYWSGPILLAFIIYHLLHFTFGVSALSPQFNAEQVWMNVYRGFSNPIVSVWYIISMGLLCMHLYHGLWSAFQSLGASHPRYTPLLQQSAKLVAVLIFLGYSSIPVSVMTGFADRFLTH